MPKLIFGISFCFAFGGAGVGYCMGTNMNSSLNLYSTEATQQANVKVRGIVTDEKGEPLVGALIKVRGLNTGVITNVDGGYEITVKDNNAILEFSFIGYINEEKKIGNRKLINVTLKEDINQLEEVVVVGYGSQKKETLTGAVSSIGTEALLRSSGASLANSLAGQLPGVSSVQSSGQPGADDATIYLRGVGTLDDAASKPLILVDGVERDFFQMDPNEIEAVSILKDASATAVFGVRGANGVIMVTTRRGKEGKAKINISSSVGFQKPTRMLKMADSYDWATLYNERQYNDGMPFNDLEFTPYELERFRLGDEPILYPSVDWRNYLMNDMALQTQHNINVSGGTKNVKYFISAGFLFQDGIFKNFKNMGYDPNYSYNRYNYRANLDLNVTTTTILKMGIGGIMGNKKEPRKNIFELLRNSAPFNSPGEVDGKKVITNPVRFPMLDGNAFGTYYGSEYIDKNSNTLNLDMHLIQDLGFITQGLSAEIKGAYNTDYSYGKTVGVSVETYTPYHYSELRDPHLNVGDPTYNYDVVYQIGGANNGLNYANLKTSRGRNWYLEGSLRYTRQFSDHNISLLALYNQHKKYYPSQYSEVPTAYIGFVGRATYDYKSRYLAEFNFGYNGSENFAPGKRFGKFPAGSVGWVVTEESFFKDNGVVDYLKIRGSVGLVGNDNISNYRFLYLPNGYDINYGKFEGGYGDPTGGYIFGSTNTIWDKGAKEKTIGNPNVTWETALKMNVGVDLTIFKNRLRIAVDVFKEKRSDILIKRSTVPLFTSLQSGLLPVVNMGRVDNKGYEIDLKWNDKINDFSYWIQANLSYSKNKIIFQDEVEPEEPYMWRTGNSTGSIFGYVTERFYEEGDFNEDGTLKEGPFPNVTVHPGDLKYKNLNGDDVIDHRDQKLIGGSKRPPYMVGFNYGINYKGFFATMNWTAGIDGNVLMAYNFNNPFRTAAVYKYYFDDRWTEETVATAKYPRVSETNSSYNSVNNSTTWVKDNSYLKLKTMTVGYNFVNKKFLKVVGISALTVKLSGDNLFTFDKIDFMDPEGNPNNADTYPIMKNFVLGLNVTF